MQTRSIRKQFFKYAVPAVIGMLVQALYVILDGVIVGQGIGEIALASVNIAFPITMVVIALGMLIAVGGANIYSFYKGEGKLEKSNNVFAQCLMLAAIIGGALTLAGSVLREPLAIFLGANDALLPSTSAYLKWITLFFLLQMLVCCLSVFVRNDDAPKLVMFASVFGAVTNAVLDIIFVLVLHYGIEATAITNGIGMLIEISFLLIHFARRKGALRIKLPKFNFSDIKRVFSNGFATFLMEFSLPAITFSFNLAIIRTEGTLGVTAYSIVGYVCAVINMILIGITQGAQPLMSLYRGKGDKESFAQIYHMGIRTSIIVPIVLVAACALFSDSIVSLFIPNNPELKILAAHILRLYPMAHIAIGVTLMNILYLQTTEHNAYSALISFLRCIGFVQVFIVISFFLLDGAGLYLSFAAGEICNLILSILIVRRIKTPKNQVGKKAPMKNGHASFTNIFLSNKHAIPW